VASSADIVVAAVAGEASGDLLASRLLSGLRPHLPDARFHGIGGHHMAEQGFVSDWPMERLTVRGLLAVIPRYRDIKGIQNALRDQLLAERPAVFIGADYPGFNLGLEMQLKAAGIPTVHYIGPQIWAWRGGRIKKIIKAVSHMLVVFPFEEQLYRDAGVPVTYVGHPLAELIPLAPDEAAARRALGLAQDANVVTLMPGSRMSELKYNAAAFVGAARLLLARDKSLRFVAPMAGERQRQYFLELVAKAGLGDVDVMLLDGQSHTAICAADAVLVASGIARGGAIQEADGHRIQDDGGRMADTAPFRLPAVDRPAQYPGARIPGAGTAAGRRQPGGAGRCRLGPARRCAAPAPAGPALHRHASQPAAQQRPGKRRCRAARDRCRRGRHPLTYRPIDRHLEKHLSRPV